MLIFEKYISNEIGFIEKAFFSMRIRASKSFRNAFSEYRIANSYLRMLFLCSTAEQEMQSEFGSEFYKHLDIIK